MFVSVFRLRGYRFYCCRTPKAISSSLGQLPHAVGKRGGLVFQLVAKDLGKAGADRLALGSRARELPFLQRGNRWLGQRRVCAWLDQMISHFACCGYLKDDDEAALDFVDCHGLRVVRQHGSLDLQRCIKLMRSKAILQPEGRSELASQRAWLPPRGFGICGRPAVGVFRLVLTVLPERGLWTVSGFVWVRCPCLARMCHQARKRAREPAVSGGIRPATALPAARRQRKLASAGLYEAGKRQASKRLLCRLPGQAVRRLYTCPEPGSDRPAGHRYARYRWTGAPCLRSHRP